MTARRQFLTQAVGAGVALAAGRAPAAAPAQKTGGLRYCFNTSTIMGQKLGIVKEVEVAAQAGYTGVEVWVRAIETYVAGGGKTADLRQRIAGLGLTVEGAISFAQWIAEDPAQRAKGLEQARREMDLVAQIGGKRIAAPPAGGNKGPAIALDRIAERYRALLELGKAAGVTPALELWGASTNLHTLAQCAYVAIASGNREACILPDVYHIYKGGGGFEGLNLLSAAAVQVIHVNDYPDNPPRETITDKDRIYPGDGIAPLSPILGGLQKINPEIVLSLELFNPEYWKLDALEVAKTGLQKMRMAMIAAVGPMR